MARLCCLTQLGMLLMGVWLAKGTVRISLGGEVVPHRNRIRLGQYILHTFLIQSFDSLPSFAGRGDMVRCSRQDMECTLL